MSVSSSSSFSSPTGAQHPRGLAFSDALMREVRERFLLVERDHHGRERLYFDNAGGSFRLKAAIDDFLNDRPTNEVLRPRARPQGASNGHAPHGPQPC